MVALKCCIGAKPTEETKPAEAPTVVDGAVNDKKGDTEAAKTDDAEAGKTDEPVKAEEEKKEEGEGEEKKEEGDKKEEEVKEEEKKDEVKEEKVEAEDTQVWGVGSEEDELRV